ncbi:hypothetical protein BDW75DRAFT_128853 [Aspergillus navahoensis]
MRATYQYPGWLLAMYQIDFEIFCITAYLSSWFAWIPKISHIYPTTRHAFTSKAQYRLQDLCSGQGSFTEHYWSCR